MNVTAHEFDRRLHFALALDDPDEREAFMRGVMTDTLDPDDWEDFINGADAPLPPLSAAGA